MSVSTAIRLNFETRLWQHLKNSGHNIWKLLCYIPTTFICSMLHFSIFKRCTRCSGRVAAQQKMLADGCTRFQVLGSHFPLAQANHPIHPSLASELVPDVPSKNRRLSRMRGAIQKTVEQCGSLFRYILGRLLLLLSHRSRMSWSFFFWMKSTCDRWTKGKNKGRRYPIPLQDSHSLNFCVTS